LDAANLVEDPRAPAAAALMSAAARLSAADYDLAGLEYQRALGLARTEGWLEGQAEAHNRIGVVLWETERLGPAVEHLRAARDLTERTQDWTGQAAAWHNLAVLYWHLGELAVAADHFGHGLALYRAARSALGEGMSDTCLGGVLTHLGGHAEAYERLSKALALNRRLGNRRFEVLALGLLALLHRNTSDLRAAVAHARSAVLVAADLGPSRDRVDVLNMAGTVLVSAGFPDEARQHLDTAHEIAQRGTPYVTGVVQADQGLADVCLATGDVSRARALAEGSLIPSRRAGYRMEEGTALITLAQAALAEGNRGEAARLAAQAEAVLDSTGYRWGIDRARAVRASASG
jgi:tetratricopeptide (TPR) repeat protein